MIWCFLFHFAEFRWMMLKDWTESHSLNCQFQEKWKYITKICSPLPLETYQIQKNKFQKILEDIRFYVEPLMSPSPSVFDLWHFNRLSHQFSRGKYSSIGSSGRVRGARNIKSMRPPLAAIFLWIIFTRPVGIMAPLPPPSPSIRYCILCLLLQTVGTILRRSD